MPRPISANLPAYGGYALLAFVLEQPVLTPCMVGQRVADSAPLFPIILTVYAIEAPFCPNGLANPTPTQPMHD